jgi:transcription antitermination factor NusG
LVGHGPEGTPLGEEEIESVKTLVDQGVPWITHPFLQAGQRIRIRGGALDGLEGIFQSQSGQDMLIVSINAIQRSLSVSLRGYEIEVI